MKVKELRDLLENLDDEIDVFLYDDMHDDYYQFLSTKLDKDGDFIIAFHEDGRF